MKATIEIPDAIYRRIKARSALDGRSVRDVTVELYERWLAESADLERSTMSDDERVEAAAAWMAGWGAIGRSVAEAGGDQPTTREILVADRR